MDAGKFTNELAAQARKHGYSCTSVSWEDVERFGGSGGGGVSCWGPNISDVMLGTKTSRALFTIRPDNWDERIRLFGASDVMIMPGPLKESESEKGQTVEPVSLVQWLQEANKTGGAYVGLESALDAPALDETVGVRFQCVFLPSGLPDQKPEDLQFCTRVRNYQTSDSQDPRNLLLLCTSQGSSMQQDQPRMNSLRVHRLDAEGELHAHWLEAEQTRFKVAEEQRETKEEIAANVARGKAVAKSIGLSGMGDVMNALMLIQIPVEQAPQEPLRKGKSLWPSSGAVGPKGSPGCCGPSSGSAGSSGMIVDLCAMDDEYDEEDGEEYFDEEDGGPEGEEEEEEEEELCGGSANLFGNEGDGAGWRCRPEALKKKIGTTRVARVSLGPEEPVAANEKRLCRGVFKRDPKQHISVTVTLYYIVKDGVPSEEDFSAALNKLDSLYGRDAVKRSQWLG